MNIPPKAPLIKPRQSDNDPLSYSIFLENKTYSSSPDENSYLQQKINTIYPKSINKWIDGSIIYKCQNCDRNFTFFVRQHHCRACGYVFCSNCCHKYTLIPADYLKKPEKDVGIRVLVSDIYRHLRSTVKRYNELVCNDCFQKLENLRKITHIISIAGFLDLKDLYMTSLVSKDWHNASIHYLSKFRNIQYYSPEKILTKWETNIIWNNRYNLVQHNNWFPIVVKSGIYRTLLDPIDEVLPKVEQLLTYVSEDTINSRISCWSTMCSRRCHFDVDILDYLHIMLYISKLPPATKFHPKIIFILDRLLQLQVQNRTIGEYYLKFDVALVTHISLISRKFLESDNKCLSGGKVTTLVYRLLQVIVSEQEINSRERLYQAWYWEWSYLDSYIGRCHHDTQFKDLIWEFLQAQLTSEYLTELGRTQTQFRWIHRSDMIERRDIEFPLTCPFEASYIIVDIVEVKKMQSSSKPTYIKARMTPREYDIEKFPSKTRPFYKKKHRIKPGYGILDVIQESSSEDYSSLLDSDNDDNENLVDIEFILKEDRHIRKEQVVSGLISILQGRLLIQSYRQRIPYFEPIPTYDIYSVRPGFGIIQFVKASRTLREINMDKFTLQNYILDNNPSQSIEKVKERFSKSLAVSSCISYLLGLGDRHLDNIMVTRRGQLFHIDYGYLMENPKTNIMGSPVIRVTNEMVDFLGGPYCQRYKAFKSLIADIFNILRLYYNLVIDYYQILDSEYLVKHWKIFREELYNRFMPGLTCKDAEISLLKEIENSSSSYKGKVIDFCHHQKNQLTNMIRS